MCVLPPEVEQWQPLPSCFSSYTVNIVNMSFFFFSHFFSFYGVFKMTTEHSLEMSSGVPITRRP